MAYGRGKVLLNGATGPPVAVPVLRSRVPADGRGHDVLREVEDLRAANESLAREIAELRERELQAQLLADRDPLTGLYNRRRMLELLQGAVAAAMQQDQCVGLLFIDLNGFKGINDGYGHAAGDRILTTVARRISARVRTGDIVCRYGGDEFVVILPNVPDAGALYRVADAIRERVSLPCWIRGSEQHLTAAIGESMFPHDGRTADELLLRADQAMYRLKARLERPMLSLSSVAQHRPLRRRNDKYKPGDGG